MVIGIYYFLVLLHASFVDIRQKQVKRITYLLLIIPAVYYHIEHAGMYLAGAVFVTAPVLIFATCTDGMGGGDVKFIFMNALILGIVPIYCSILLGLSSMIFIHTARRMVGKPSVKTIPFIPYLSTGCLIGYLLTYL